MTCGGSTAWLLLHAYPQPPTSQDADADKSGEIDFDEFVTIVKKQLEMPSSSPAGGRQGGIAAVAMRKKKNESPMRWRVDKMGPGVCSYS